MNSRRASVLILSLWSLFFLGALALAVAGYVSAAIDTARFLKNETKAYYLARAGIDKAVAMVLTNTSGFINVPEAFRDQALGDEAAGDMEFFSVTHLYMSNSNDESWGVYTNYGIATYGVNDASQSRINIDERTDHAVTRAQLEGLGLLGPIIENILSYDPEQQSPGAGKRTVEKGGVRTYGSHFLSVQELLAVEGLGWPEYSLLEPLVTIDRFKWLREGGQRRSSLNSYGGLSEGRIELMREDGSLERIASSRIAFVFSVTNDAERVEFLHWREY